MERIVCAPRPDWIPKVEALGMIYHHTDGQVYWKESARYELTTDDVDELEGATNELWARCLDAVQYVLDKGRLPELGIPAAAVPLIQRSWDEDHASIYGRFDLAYGAGGPPKLLEFNADTPTMLLEASVIQWHWLRELHPKADQFNSIHERLVAKWKALRDGGHVREPVFFAHLDHVEDLMTTTYLRDTAREAGLATEAFFIADLGWDGTGFRTPTGDVVRTIFKLYPWEQMWREAFAPHLYRATALWIEPAWRLVLSNKAILAILWELFPGHPNLVPAYLHAPHDLTAWVRKPAFGREGNNLTMRRPNGAEINTYGPYGGETPHVFQAYTPLPVFDGTWHALVGSWVIDGEAAGIGMRESDTPITRNESPFVPHLIAGGAS